ncbi:MAG: LytTR family DNA-binding domain-containing protein [Bacteroidota bacterium]
MISQKKLVFEVILIVFTTMGFSLISEGPSVWEELSISSIYNTVFTFFMVVSSWWGLKKIHQNLDRTAVENGTNTITLLVITTLVLSGYAIIANWIYIELIWREKLINTHFYSMVLPLAILTFISWNLLYLNRFIFEFPNDFNGGKHLTKEDGKLIVDKVIVSNGRRKLVFQISDIAFFGIENDVTFAFTFKGQQYLIENSLSELERKMGPDKFFRINRQYIVSKNAVIDFNPLTNQRIRVRFSAQQDSDLSAEISRYKSAKFKKWIYS